MALSNDLKACVNRAPLRRIRVPLTDFWAPLGLV